MKTILVLSVLVAASLAAQVPVSPNVFSAPEGAPIVVQQQVETAKEAQPEVSVAVPVIIPEAVPVVSVPLAAPAAVPVVNVPQVPAAAKQAVPAYNGVQYPPASYDFAWAVKDDLSYVDMGHSEARKGDLTTGEYFVLLPDGRRQIVKYRVDGYSGFVPQVSYVQEQVTRGGAYNAVNKY